MPFGTRLNLKLVEVFDEVHFPTLNIWPQTWFVQLPVSDTIFPISSLTRAAVARAAEGLSNYVDDMTDALHIPRRGSRVRVQGHVAFAGVFSAQGAEDALHLCSQRVSTVNHASTAQPKHTVAFYEYGLHFLKCGAIHVVEQIEPDAHRGDDGLLFRNLVHLIERLQDDLRTRWSLNGQLQAIEPLSLFIGVLPIFLVQYPYHLRPAGGNSGLSYRDDNSSKVNRRIHTVNQLEIEVDTAKTRRPQDLVPAYRIHIGTVLPVLFFTQPPTRQRPKDKLGIQDILRAFDHDCWK
jgi:hypothetical protein